MSQLMTLQHGVRQFMTIGGQSVDAFNAKQAGLYIGLILEEVKEMIVTVSDGCVNEHDRLQLVRFSAAAEILGQHFKAGMFVGDVMRCDHGDLIDDLFDTAFVAVGALYSTAKLGDEAIAAGCQSNLDKYPDGKVLRDEHGKIKKPIGWKKPDFSVFADQEFLARRDEHEQDSF